MEISHSKVEAFGFLSEKVQRKLQGWREKCLSVAGKEVLIKAVIQSIPTYVMSCFELPNQLCLDIQQLMANFWWGNKGAEKKIHWMTWDKLCDPKADGGMGFRNLHLFNLSLLAKQGWRLIMYPDSLVAQVFKARYFPNSNFLNAVAQLGMSFTWRSILAGRSLLSKGLRFQIGGGIDVSLWNDPWLPLPFSFKPYSLPMEGTESWRVCDIIDQDNGEWVKDVVVDLFTEDEALLILKIPLSVRSAEDRLIWHYDRNGIFSVKSGYHVARSFKNLASSSTSSGTNGNSLWKKLWGLCIPPKVRLFVWRLLRGILPSKGNLRKKVLLADVDCVFCHSHVANDLHLFKHCDVLESFWWASMGLKPKAHMGQNILDWFLEISFSSRGNQLDLFCMALWVIWNTRNDIVWNEGSFNPMLMAFWTTNKLEEYKRLQPPCIKKPKRLSSKWENPPSGRLKINVDGSFRVGEEQGGIGVVVRDEKGQCIAALSRSLSHVSSALHAEAEACRAGLLLATYQGWDDLIIETDCAMVATAIASSSDDYSQIGRIVGDCQGFLNSFNSIEVRHVYREANRVAHRLACVASFYSLDVFCLGETPSIIEDVLLEDCCNFTRGIGFTSPSRYNCPLRV